MGQGLYPGRAQWCALILLGGVKHAGGVCQFVGLRAREGRAIYLAVQGIELRAFAMRYIPRPFYVKTLSQLLNCLDWAQTCNPSVLASECWDYRLAPSHLAEGRLSKFLEYGFMDKGNVKARRPSDPRVCKE